MSSYVDRYLSSLWSGLPISSAVSFDMERYLPSDWSRLCPETEVDLVDLDTCSVQYENIKSSIDSANIKVNITKICRVQNPMMYARFVLRQREYDSRSISFRIDQLFHETARRNIDSIVKNNLDWRRVSRSKFGKGVSFSPSASYAFRYSARGTGSERALIVNDVIVGREMEGSYDMVIPQQGYDTTGGNCGKVIVKYYDDEFYPKYIVYYRL